MSALQGGIGGMGLASSLSGLAGLGALGSTGGMAGAGILGALFGLSDRRLKEGIRAIGKLANGLAIYSFRYINSTLEHIGLMADEVEAYCPAAVKTYGPHAIKVVNYSLAVK